MRNTKPIPEGIGFRQIPQFPDHSISECGLYIASKRGTMITLADQKRNGKPTGYIYSTLLAVDYRYFKRVAVHRLVAYAWLNAPESNKHIWVNHKDGNKANNNASNLEWTTISQNIQHAYDTGLKHAKKGSESHLYGKTASFKTRSIMSEKKLGRNHPKWKGDYIVFGKRYNSANQAGKALNIPAKTVQHRAANPKFIDYSFVPKEVILAANSVEHVSNIL